MPTRKLTVSLALLSFCLARPAAAALPQAEPPTRGNGVNIIQTMQNYGYDGAMLLGLVLLVVMFLGTAWHAFGVYHEIHEGKKKWRDLGSTAVVGVGIVAVGIYFVTKATAIL